MTDHNDKLTMELPDSGFLSDEEIGRKFRSQIARSFRAWPKCKEIECQKDLQLFWHRKNGVVKCTAACIETHASAKPTTAPAIGSNYVGDWNTSNTSSASGTYDSWGKKFFYDDKEFEILFKDMGSTLIFSGW